MIYQYSFDDPGNKSGEISNPYIHSCSLELSGAQIPVTIENVSYVIEELRKDGVKIETHQCLAIIDTGASMCVISNSIAAKLNLHFEKFTPVSFMEGGANLPTYPAIIRFDWGTPYYVPVVACDLDDRFECFIGRDILAKMILTYNGREGIITIDDGLQPDIIDREPINIFQYWYFRAMTFFGLSKKKI